MKIDFNNLVIEMMGSIFEKYNLRIVDEYKGNVKVKSPSVVIVIARSEREGFNYFYIGRAEDSSVLVDDDIMLKVFNSNIKIERLPIEQFLTNLNNFFNAEGRNLLLCEQEYFTRLEEFDRRKSKEYTARLEEERLLGIADRAWAEKDYKNFVQCLEKIEMGNLLPSYQLKYKIARNKIKN